MAYYELALMGAPTDEQVVALEIQISQIIEAFGLHLNDEVGWSVRTPNFDPLPGTAAAAVFIGKKALGLTVSLASGPGKRQTRRWPLPLRR